MPAFSAFITPQSHELPHSIRVLTTTRLFPTPTDPVWSSHHTHAPSDATPWPDCEHPKATALEAAFHQQGAGLQQILPSAPYWLNQVHGIDVVEAHHNTSPAVWRHTLPVADASMTRTPHVTLAIRTADCLPVVIADADGTTLAAAHAGWRGLAAGVIETSVARMALPPSRLYAWLGPAIGPRVFEVGADVFAAFGAAADSDIAACFVPVCDKPHHWLADLPALARLRLQRLGVTRISGGTWCTYSDRERLFSYRRGDEGQMATFAWLEPHASHCSEHHRT